MSSTTYLKRIAEATEAGGSLLSDSSALNFTATTTAADVLIADPDRVDADFTNNSSTIAVWANEYGTAVVGSAGQRVKAGGQFIAKTKNALSVIAESGTVHCSGSVSPAES